MATHAPPFEHRTAGPGREETHARPSLSAPIGRVLLALVFLLSAPGHFSPTIIGYAAAQGVPAASVLVPLAGILAFVGGLSVALGYRARIGAWMLVVFLVPVTLMMHRFWAAGDPAVALLQRVMFLKNLAILGGALVVTHFGAGPVSFDAMREVRAQRAARAPSRPD